MPRGQKKIGPIGFLGFRHIRCLRCTCFTSILFVAFPLTSSSSLCRPKPGLCQSHWGAFWRRNKSRHGLCAPGGKPKHIYTFVPCNLHQFQFDDILQEGCLDVSVCGRPERSVSSFQSTKRLALPQFKLKRKKKLTLPRFAVMPLCQAFGYSKTRCLCWYCWGVGTWG